VVRDGAVQAAIKIIVIKPIFEADFQPCSFGFRPKRSALHANGQIRQIGSRRYDCVADTDIEDYFETIDHDKLMARGVKEDM